MISRARLRIRDPFVLNLADGGFLLYGSTDANTWSGPGAGFDCYRSADLEHWEGPVAAFRPPTGFWGTMQFWAPEVWPAGERFLMLASFSDGVHRGTQALLADRPDGPFVPVGDEPMTPTAWSCLDGTLHLEDGVGWLVFCHEWRQVGDGRIVAQRLDESLTRAVGDPVVLFTASEAPWTRAVPMPEAPAPGEHPAEGYVTDGPFLHRTHTGELLMLWSSIGEHGYATGVARSVSGGILGPWEQQPEPLWPEDGGHAMLFRGRDGELLLALHQPNDSPRERAVFTRVHDEGGRIVRETEQASSAHADHDAG